MFNDRGGRCVCNRQVAPGPTASRDLKPRDPRRQSASHEKHSSDREDASAAGRQTWHEVVRWWTVERRTEARAAGSSKEGLEVQRNLAAVSERFSSACSQGALGALGTALPGSQLLVMWHQPRNL